ncbi:iron-sulfur cluster co-chaperone protein HscB-like [Diadema setosum]|uniref:iron-sulfur cluster co-chaperone protein HscB-like n=1 Tax=Diadema setosum TaxID=31175 RepID=UPI003B3A0781
MASLTKCWRMTNRTFSFWLSFSPLRIFVEERLPPHTEIRSLPRTLHSQLQSKNVCQRMRTPRPVSHMNSRAHVNSGVKYVRCSSSTTRTCWNCHAALLGDLSASAGHEDVLRPSVAFFCQSCSMIQPLDEDLNHFQILGVEEKFDVDIADLTSRFRNLQRVLHPDKFGKTSKMEQSFSALQSSAVNKAYKVLLKPLSRGMYLLELHGHSIEEGESSIDPAFLMEVMEVNEELANTDDLAAVHRIGKDNSVRLDALLNELRRAFKHGNFPSARETLMRLKYYANIDDKVKEKLGT